MNNLLGIAVIVGLISAGSQQQSLNLTLSEKPELVYAPSPTLEEPYKCCWTGWFNSSHPSGKGEWELVPCLRTQYPGKICDNPMDIEAQTFFGLSPAAAGDELILDKDTGLICKNAEQPDKKCHDYRVRFCCPAPYCADEVCWTDWFDRDNPSGTGDWETLKDLQKQYPGKICKKPKYIEAVTVSDNIPASATGQNFFKYNPTEGFVCKNKYTKPVQNCKDYKVRFGCCCDSGVIWKPTPVLSLDSVLADPFPMLVEPDPTPMWDAPDPTPVKETPRPTPIKEIIQAAIKETLGPVKILETPAPVLLKERPAPVLIQETPAPVLLKERPAPVLIKETPAPVLIQETPAPVLLKERPAPVLIQETPAPVPLDRHR